MDHDNFIGYALDEAQTSIDAGNIAVGSVIVRDGEIIGRGQNRVESEKDVTAHAEVDAIRNACRNAGPAALVGATLYTVCEPCPMCLGAINEAGITCLVLGGRHSKVGITRFGDYCVERMVELTNSDLKLVTGIRENECEEMRRRSS